MKPYSKLQESASYIIIIRVLLVQKRWRSSLWLSGSSTAQWSQKPCLVTHLLSEAGWLCYWDFWQSHSCSGGSFLLSLLEIKSWMFACSIPVAFKAVFKAPFWTWCDVCMTVKGSIHGGKEPDLAGVFHASGFEAFQLYQFWPPGWLVF